MTDQGPIRARTVVICEGMWSRDLAAQAGVTIPLHTAEHFYIVTEQVEGLPRDLPVLFLGDEWTYDKEDAGKLPIGFFESNAKPWGQAGIPEDFVFGTLPEDVDHIAPYMKQATRRVPVLERTGVQLFFTGPESFTPDDRYLLGETPEVLGLFCATGFNSVGILSSGGVCKTLAEWIRDRRPPVELMDVDIRRLQAFMGNRKYLEDVRPRPSACSSTCTGPAVGSRRRAAFAAARSTTGSWRRAPG